MSDGFINYEENKQCLSIYRVDRVLWVDLVDQVDPVDRVDWVDQPDWVEQADRVDRVDRVDRASSVLRGPPLVPTMALPCRTSFWCRSETKLCYHAEWDRDLGCDHTFPYRADGLSRHTSLPKYMSHSSKYEY